jgi:hypothetical protein
MVSGVSAVCLRYVGGEGGGGLRLSRSTVARCVCTVLDKTSSSPEFICVIDPGKKPFKGTVVENWRGGLKVVKCTGRGQTTEN